MIKLTWGQKAVLITATVPMAATGVAGAIATFVNMRSVLPTDETALGIVAAGEGATLVCATVALLVTLLGQHTPAVVRAGLWLLPVAASALGLYLAPNSNMAAVMAATPMAMTAAGEGLTLVARRVVAHNTGVDIEQQRRSGLLLWHANRAANGGGLGRILSQMAVWRLTKQFAATDGQLSVQLGEIQRYRISEGADINLAAVLAGSSQRPAVAPAEPVPALPPVEPSKAVTEAHSDLDEGDEDDGSGWIQGLMADYAEQVAETTHTVTLLTGDDVAERLNVKPGTVRSWVGRGKLRIHDKDENGRSLFHPDDVARLP